MFYNQCHFFSIIEKLGENQICNPEKLLSGSYIKELRESHMGLLPLLGSPPSLTQVASHPCRDGGHGCVQLHWKQCV
jgi:hypothetical protein